VKPHAATPGVVQIQCGAPSSWVAPAMKPDLILARRRPDMIEPDELPDNEAFAWQPAAPIPGRPSLADGDEVGWHAVGHRLMGGRAIKRQVAARARSGGIESGRARPPACREVDMPPFHGEGTAGGDGR
jgi:hypothetical protein